MQKTHSGTRQGDKAVHRSALLAVLAMSPQQIERLSIPKRDGIAVNDYSIVLDAYVRRQRALQLGKTWGSDDHAKVLRRLAERRGPTRELSSCALFRFYGIWNEVQEAALSYAYLQLGAQLDRTARLPSWFTSSSTTYKALAAWSCGLRRIQLSDSPLFYRLLAEGRKGIRQMRTIQDNTTGHWLLWLATTRGISRETCWDIAKQAGVFCDR